MYQSINRNSGLFTKAKTDTINNMIYKIDKKIDDLEVEDLEYKYPVSNIYISSKYCSNNNSFTVGQLKVISCQLSMPEIKTGITRIGECSFSDSPIIIGGCDDNGINYALLFKNKRIYLVSKIDATNKDLYFYGVFL